MLGPPEDLGVAKERILAEFAAVGFGDNLTAQKAMELRKYAKEKMNSDLNLSATQRDIWKSLYDGLTQAVRESAPDLMARVEPLEKQQDAAQTLKNLMESRLNAHPHDFGVRAWWGFVIIGLLVGWVRSRDAGTMALYGCAFWIAGMFFCIFALDSAEVQSKIAIFLYHRLGAKRISRWLYNRALTVR